MSANTTISIHPVIALERHLTLMRDMRDLARELGVSRDYIQAMKWHGFKMPGGKASLRMARGFLETCPTFKVTKLPPEPLPPQAESSDR